MAALASVATGYVWEDPGDSIMIQVNLDLVERLGAAVQQGLGAGPRGNEIGGVLLGRALPGFRRAVLVEDFELVPCEHFRGASYTLSPQDKRRLGIRLANRGARQVVGYFRSHTRPGMYLDQDDFAVFGRYFPEAWQVFLLVRPSTEGPAAGGFFFWEDGDVNRRSPYRQFPFDCARLAQGDFPITGERPTAAPAPRPVPVLVPKPEPRVRRGLPSLPWVVVPAIAGLFLLAGLFVSENQAPAPPAAAAKVAVPVEPLLPEPVPGPQATLSTPAEPPVPSVEPVSEVPAAAVPIVAPKPKLVKNPLPHAAVPPPVTSARATPRDFEPPPVLSAPPARTESKLAPVLGSRFIAAPPPEVDVSYEVRHGVIGRALHKIEGSVELPPSPIRKVAPMRPADAGADARQVDVKVFIDDAGNVTRAQLLSKGGDQSGAALNAARQWQFTPARKRDKPVPSEMVLHFHFGGI